MTTTAARDTVADVMSTPVLTIELGESMLDAWQLLVVSGFRHLAVIDEDGSCVGIVSDRVVLADVHLETEALRRRRVRDVMGRVPFASISPYASPLEAAQRMTDLSTEAVVVLHEGRLLGIVTQTDLVRWVAGSPS